MFQSSELVEGCQGIHVSIALMEQEFQAIGSKTGEEDARGLRREEMERQLRGEVYSSLV